MFANLLLEISIFSVSLDNVDIARGDKGTGSAYTLLLILSFLYERTCI